MRPSEEETIVQPPGPPPEEMERQLWPWLLVLLLLVVGGVLAGWVLTHGGGKKQHPVAVPDVVGLAQGPAVVRIEGLGLKTKVETQFSSKEKAGIVVAQSPQAGQSLDRGGLVTLGVSRGQRAVVVPQPGQPLPGRRGRSAHEGGAGRERGAHSVVPGPGARRDPEPDRRRAG